MHKGNRYPTERRGRPWMQGTSPSFFIASEYKVEGVNWVRHVGGPAPAADFDGIVLQSIDYGTLTVVYYTSFLWSGHNVNFGFQLSLNASHTHPTTAGYLTVDGADQNDPVAFNATNEDWQGVPYDTLQWSVKTGAILFPDFDFFEAVGW